MRSAVQLAALLFTILMAFLTLSVIAKDGLDVLTVASLVIIAMFAFGIVGALRHPPDE